MLFSYFFDIVAFMFRRQNSVIPTFYFAVYHFNIDIKSTYIQYFVRESQTQTIFNEKVNVVCYVTKYVLHVTLVNCMIAFRYLLYLNHYLLLKYISHSYSQCWDKLSNSNVDFIEKIVIVLSFGKMMFLHCTLRHPHFHQPLRIVR